jgi:hypothetical protein
MSAGARASARTSASGANARSAGARQEQMQGVRGRKECGGRGLFQHQRVRSQCKMCGGAICPHQRIRSLCKECREEADTSMPSGLEELAGPAHASGKDL